MGMKVWMCLSMYCVLALVGTTSGERDTKKEYYRVKVYLHDAALYKNASFNTATQEVASSKTMSTPANNFGAMYVFDDVITSGPSMRSQTVGSAQGLYVYSGRTNLSAFWACTAFLGERGSISFMGSEIILNPSLRSLPIVGGTGAFAGSRGVVTLSTAAIKLPVYFVLSLDFHLST